MSQRQSEPVATATTTTAAAPAASAGASSLSCNVFVNYIPLDVTDADFAKRFETYGTVTSSRIMRHLEKASSATAAAAASTTTNDGTPAVPTPQAHQPLPRSKGYGFVMFSTPEMALAAVAAEHGAAWGNKKLSVSIAARGYGDDAASSSNNNGATTAAASSAAKAPKASKKAPVQDDGVVKPETTTDGAVAVVVEATSNPPAKTPKAKKTLQSAEGDAAPQKKQQQKSSPSSGPTILADGRCIDVGPVVGPVHQIIQALSIFGDVEQCQMLPHSGKITVTFDSTIHASSAIKALHGNVVRSLHPTSPLTAAFAKPVAPSTTTANGSSKQQQQQQSTTPQQQPTPIRNPRQSVAASLPNVVPLQTTANTQITSYPFPTSPHVRVGGVAGIGGVPLGWRHPALNYARGGPFPNTVVGSCPHGPHCHCSSRTPFMGAAAAVGPIGSPFSPTQPQQPPMHQLPQPRNALHPGMSQQTPAAADAPIKPVAVAKPPTGPVSNPLTAVFSKAVKEANALAVKEAALQKQHSSTASEYFEAAAAATTRGAPAAPYTPTPVRPIRDFAALPFPGASAGGYVDGYGTAAGRPLQQQQQSAGNAAARHQPYAAAAPTTSCHYCADVTTVILHNTPTDDMACRRLVDEQLGQFGYIKFTECWGDGDAVVAFFQERHAENAVATLHESEYQVDYFDCSGQHRYNSNAGY